MKRIFILVNVDTFFLSHRKEIALRAQDLGYDVTIIANDTGKGAYIQSLGLRFINLPINKSGLNIWEELKTFVFLLKLLQRERPMILHMVGLKTILWGGLAARILGVTKTVSAISGLGVMFSPEYNKGIKNLLSHGILLLMRYIHGSEKSYCIFHNNEDMDLFVSNKIIPRERCLRTMGSGIDLNEYMYIEEQLNEPLKVLFTARMVEDKGVLVLIDAAEKLRHEYQGRVQFLLCGGLETNPLAVSKDKLEKLCDGDYIQWLGKRNDVKTLLENCHVFAFPSYYKEGLPKSCIEANAIGRPVITCDSIGCRDTVIDGRTGYLIPMKDSKTLAEKLKILFDDGELRRQMGRNARQFAESTFSIENVIMVHVQLYNYLSNN